MYNLEQVKREIQSKPKTKKTRTNIDKRHKNRIEKQTNYAFYFLNKLKKKELEIDRKNGLKQLPS